MISCYWVPIPAQVRLSSLTAGLAVLDAAERQTYERYRVDFKKVEFLTGRLLLKRLLAGHLNTEPCAVRFIKNAYGKLFLHPDLRGAGLFFNLSHTDRLVACALSPFPFTGIDVELSTKPHFDVMPQVFVDDEIRFVQSQPTLRERLTAFYRLWTRKEAVMKATGKGFSLPPKSFTVPLTGGHARDGVYDYHTYELGPDYLCSLAYAYSAPGQAGSVCTPPPSQVDFWDLFAGSQQTPGKEGDFVNAGISVSGSGSAVQGHGRDAVRSVSHPDRPGR
jgi:4'-phosphopantetheinyl transferase